MIGLGQHLNANKTNQNQKKLHIRTKLGMHLTLFTTIYYSSYHRCENKNLKIVSKEEVKEYVFLEFLGKLSQ